MITSHEIRVGVAICTPIPFVRKPDGSLRHAHITIDWHRHRQSMMVPTNIVISELAVDGMAVDAARNRAVELVTELPKPPEFLFFLDYDVLVEHDTLVKLVYRARTNPECDIFAGVYTTKCPFPEPLIYTENGGGPYWDWAVGDLLYNIKSLHMGCTLIRTSLFDRMESSPDNPLFKTTHTQETDPVDGHLKKNSGTEDIFFCTRAYEEADAKVVIDTSILCAHQDITTGRKYGLMAYTQPIQRAHWMAARGGGKPPHEQLGLKKAIDIGAGGKRREWEGYYTYTLDVRDEVNVDYVQDARKLSLPANDFDLVASSHFLEHMGRWEQNTIWDEMYKILKPGGIMEHVVPNLDWARKHMDNGVLDEHVFNVLYGAQEAHGYEREYNSHHFGYVPDIAYAQCQRLGMEDIEITTFLEKPELGYNMIIRAKKPEIVKESVKLDTVKEKSQTRVKEREKQGKVLGKPPKKVPSVKDAAKIVRITKPKRATKKAAKKPVKRRTVATKKRRTRNVPLKKKSGTKRTARK